MASKVTFKLWRRMTLLDPDGIIWLKCDKCLFPVAQSHAEKHAMEKHHATMIVFKGDIVGKDEL